MQITKEQIEKFLKRELPADESEQIGKYFESYPEKLDEFITEAEWVDFNEVKKLQSTLSETMLSVIENKIYVQNEPSIQQHSVGKVNLVRYIAIAASVVLVSSLSILFWINNSRTPIQNTGVLAVKPSNKVQANSLYTVTNTTGKKINLVLEDGSEVVLYKNSQLAYEKPFKRTRRDLHLKGQALFKVAKDKKRPFTVFASGLATTALGTIFKITAFNGSAKTTVKLIEGKVVVKPDAQLLSKGIREQFLTPGQELCLNKNTLEARVYAVENKVKPVIKQVATTDEAILNFQDQSLENVFKQLEAEYNTPIEIASEEISKIYFTGKFNRTQDSLESILSVIATLNNLQIAKNNDGFIVSSTNP